MKKLLAIVVLSLLWSNFVYSTIDAEKVKTIKCELGSIKVGDEKFDEEQLKVYYKEGGSKFEKFKIKKDQIKSNTFKFFDNLWIKDNIITGTSTVEKENYGVIGRVERSASIDLNKMLATVNQEIFLGENGEFHSVSGLMTLNYSNCAAK